ncbi:MAG: hypothetical protein OXN17_05890 [Candidatus Poribacteria bacterium]|nr:hypothetical protein [Candidatus Poribacteria bacterium]
MDKISQFLRRCQFLLPLSLMVGSVSIAQGFEPKIVFASNRDGDWDIYSMDANGDHLAQLTNHPASDWLPACSPDGRRITFISDRDIDDLYVMDSDGTNVIRLTHDNFPEGRPSWSAHGTTFAFASLRFAVGNWEIYAMDADGQNLKNLTRDKMWDIRPSWSPDGSKIAFVSIRDGGFNTPWHIFVMNADGTERRNLTVDTVLRHSSNPSWSPDGRKIAFNSRLNFRGNDIFVITAEGEELERLTNREGANIQPIYSPDGTKIAFVSTRNGGYNIYLMDTNGMNVVRLTKTPPGIENLNPSWPHGALAVNPNGKLPISWGVLKRTGKP